MRYLIDNDWVIKLASYDLLRDAERMILSRHRNASLSALATAKDVISRGSRFRADDCRDMKRRALPFLDQCVTLSMTALAPDILGISDPDIHVGERVLLSACHGMQDFVLLSGDINFISALAINRDASAVRGRMQRRIVCVEQTILQLCQGMSFQHVFDQMTTCTRPTDHVVDNIFGTIPFEDHVIERLLVGRIGAIRRKSAGMLAE